MSCFADSPRELITRLAARRSVEVGKDWQEYTHTDAGSSSALRYSYRVSCEDNYYGVGCIALCRPRDDQFGHYSCSPNGTKVCLDGWSGPYCDQGKRLFSPCTLSHTSSAIQTAPILIHCDPDKRRQPSKNGLAGSALIPVLNFHFLAARQAS